jgi:hypothetical protein
MKIDNWFKPAILVLGIIFLLILYQYSENGRYTYHKETNNTSNDTCVVDTRTGTIYGLAAIDGLDAFYYKHELTKQHTPPGKSNPPVSR